MKKPKYVDVIFNRETGEITVEAFNFVGKACMEEAKFISDAIGQVTTTRLKPEYYKKDAKMALKDKIPLCG